MKDVRRRLARFSFLFALLLTFGVTSAFAQATAVNMMPNRDALSSALTPASSTPVVVWGNAPNASAGQAFVIDYGDGALSGGIIGGSAAAPLVNTSRGYIAAKHTYTVPVGDAAKTYTATLTIGGFSATTKILVVNRDLLSTTDALNAEKANLAIEDGLRYQYINQTNREQWFTDVNNAAVSATTGPNARTTWGDNAATGGTTQGTASAVLAFESHGYGPASASVYGPLVQSGLNALFASLNTIDFGTNKAANYPRVDPMQSPKSYTTPLSNTNLGLWNPSLGSTFGYAFPMTVLAVAASGTPNRTVSSSVGIGTYVAGQKYLEVVQRMANTIVFGQYDVTNNSRGGFLYTLNSGSDGSVFGWNVLALQDSDAFGATIDPAVKTELSYVIQAETATTTGAMGYGNGTNRTYDDSAKTGIRLQALAYIGVSRLDGTDPSDPTHTVPDARLKPNASLPSVTPQLSVDYLNGRWDGSANTPWQNVPDNKGYMYSMFNTFKGLKLMGVQYLVPSTGSSKTLRADHDWHLEYRDYLLGVQLSSTALSTDGSWNFRFSDGTRQTLTTAYSLVILSPTALILPDSDTFSTVGLSPLTTTNFVNTTHTLTATTVSTAGSPITGVTVNFTVTSSSGAPTLLLTGVTGSDGKANVTYTRATPGTDSAVAKVGSTLTSNTVEANWILREATITAGSGTKVYGNADPSFTTTQTGIQAADLPNITLATTRAPGQNGEDVGSYTTAASATGSGASSYHFTYVTGTLDITARPVTVTADAKSVVYGTFFDPPLTYHVTSGSLAFSDAFAGALTRDPGTDVGTYAIHQGTLTLGSNYNLTYVGANLDITPRALTLTAQPKTKIYGDTDPALIFTFAPSGIVLFGDHFTGALTRDPGEDVGTYAINQGTVTLGTNYVITYVGADFTIVPRKATVTAGDGTKVYGTSDPALTTSSTGFTAADLPAITLTTTRDAGEDVGSYKTHATATGAPLSNYAVIYANGNFDITKASATVTAGGGTKVYGTSDPALTTSSTGVTAADLPAITLTTTRDAGENVGSYKTHAVATGAPLSNYNVAYVDGNFDITKASATVTAGGGTKVYGTSDPTLTATSSGLTAADAATITLSVTRASGENVGDYATTAHASGAAVDNYNIHYVDGTLTITKASATVTAGSGTKVYGTSDPTLTATSSGFTAADAATITLSTSRDAGEAVGTYNTTASASGAATGNYDIHLVGGTFDITKASVTVTAGGGTKVFGTADPALATTQSGLTAADAGTVTLSTTRAAGENVGSYATTASASGAALSNYNVSYVGGTFTITKADSQVTVTCSAVTYNGLAQTPCTAVATGVGSLSVSLTPTFSNNVDAGIGTASASATYAGDDNHNGSTGSATFTINKAPSTTVVTCPVSVPYNAAAQTPCSATTTGVGTGIGTPTVSYVNNTNVGTATATGTYAGDSNHLGSSDSKNFGITKIATATTLTSSVNPSLAGTSTTLIAKVTSSAGAPTGTVTFTDGSTVIGTAPVGVGGIATLAVSTLAVGSHPIVATYSGDNNFLVSASAPYNQIVYAFAGTGSFVIGDKNAVLGTTVNFWGSQWEKNNSLTGPMANASFKGFANRPSTNPPAAGGTWITDPGNSSIPPAAIPAYMGIIVASTDVKSGSTISGNIVKIVVVKTNAGYAADPGNPGTGSIISILP